MPNGSSKSKNDLKHLDFVISDLIYAFLSFLLAYLVRFKKFPTLSGDLHTVNFIIIYILVQFIGAYALKIHKNILKRGMLDEIISVFKTVFSTLFFTLFLMYVFKETPNMSRVFVFTMMGIQIFTTFFSRQGLKQILLRRFKNDTKNKNALFIISDKWHMADLINNIRKNPLCPFNFVGIALVEPNGIEEIEGVKVVSDLSTAAAYIRGAWVDNVLIYLPNNQNLPKDFFKACSEMNVTVHSVLTIDDIESKKVSIDEIGGKTVITTGYASISYSEAVVKRAMDIVGGFIGCIFALLIIAIVGPIIYIQSPGPIIFKQTRIGKNGKKFKFYKLRSMVIDADAKKKELQEHNKSQDGMMFKMDFDPRIIGNKVLPDGTHKTGIGQFIRKTSLDEFPQFFNVLKGDMSLVGTRPPTVDEWEKYDFHHKARLTMKPGITGMWQTSGRSSITDFEEVVRLDCLYIKNFSIAGDIKILWKTVVGVLKKEGAQ